MIGPLRISTYQRNILDTGGLVDHEPAHGAILSLEAVLSIGDGPADLLACGENLPKGSIDSSLA